MWPAAGGPVGWPNSVNYTDPEEKVEDEDCVLDAAITSLQSHVERSKTCSATQQLLCVYVASVAAELKQHALNSYRQLPENAYTCLIMAV